jgi:hypothetical protein
MPRSAPNPQKNAMNQISPRRCNRRRGGFQTRPSYQNPRPKSCPGYKTKGGFETRPYAKPSTDGSFPP